MAPLDLTAIVGLVIVAFCVATAAMLASSYVAGNDEESADPGFDPHRAEPAVFLFDHGWLVDATDRASDLLARCDSGETPWRRLLGFLAPKFPDIEESLDEMGRGAKLDLWSRETAAGPTRLLAERRNGMLRITVVEPDDFECTVPVDAQNLQAMERDVRLLHALGAHVPLLIWTMPKGGAEITWANLAYSDLAVEVAGPEAARTWPPPVLFANFDTARGPRKVPVRKLESDQPHWYQLSWADLGEELVFFAADADAVVQAESALREFVQTLAKTFAHLPIGLVIFNKDRRLVLFNPALTDLTALPVDFLSDRPTLATFLDELRNRQVMPEPKDYQSWRQMITELEAEALRGTYSENWSLPGGQTYRVSGRPHPEGAIAFLFEDISSEVTLTRRFRKDLRLGQAVIDEIPSALAVFTQGGILTMANAAYVDLWGVNPATTLGDIMVVDAVGRWIELSEPNPAWGDTRDFVTAVSDRSEWSAKVVLLDGREFELRCVPLPAGDTLVEFRPRDAAEGDSLATGAQLKAPQTA